MLVSAPAHHALLVFDELPPHLVTTNEARDLKWRRNLISAGGIIVRVDVCILKISPAASIFSIGFAFLVTTVSWT
jgi:hypothetical protein